MFRRLIGLSLFGAASLVALGCGGDGDGAGGSGGAPVSGGSIVFTISGEELALGGYAFPPATPDDPAFVDGWEVRFTELLVTVDKITLSENPDLSPGDQKQTGELVAQIDGPWVVDLHKGGPLSGKGGTAEQALEIARIDKQNKNGDEPFAADRRYAFGFDVVTATDGAKLVNLDEPGKLDYELMKQNGYAVLYVGTATFKGTSCAPSDPVFDAMPKVVTFKLGFKTPTTYLNCQNPDNDPAKPFGSEEHQRGVVVRANQAVTAQLTIHTDHPFWESFHHDAPAHFDMLAARHLGEPGTPTVTLEDVEGVDPSAITASDGSPIPFRTCLSSYAPPSSGQLGFSTGGVAVSPTSDPTKAIRDLYDYMTYNASTSGHLNADGLCAVARNYPSPP